MSALLDADRMTALLDAIRQQPNLRWKSGRAVRALRDAGHHRISSSTASRYLAALAAAGHLTRHEQLGVRWYEAAPKAGHHPTTTGEDSRS